MLFLCIPLSVNASLATDLINYDYGFKNASIYINVSTLSSSYSSHFITAVSNWNAVSISPRIVYTNGVSTNSAYDLDFLYSGNQDLINNAYNAGGVYYPISFDTNPCACHQSDIFNIFINTRMVPPTISSYFKRSVMVHEIGHALGLQDISSGYTTDTIMASQRDRYTFYLPTTTYDAPCCC